MISKGKKINKNIMGVVQQGDVLRPPHRRSTPAVAKLMESHVAISPATRRSTRRIECLRGQWRQSLDHRWSEHWLYDLAMQEDRQPEFEPRANLCVRTDVVTPGSGLCMSMADLAHACLTNYFAPYRDAASVTWVSRDDLRRFMLASVMETGPGRVADYLSTLKTIDEELDKIDAILYVSRDARDFMNTHRDTFLNTLALILCTSRDRIIVQNMTWKPDCIY